MLVDSAHWRCTLTTVANDYSRTTHGSINCHDGGTELHHLLATACIKTRSCGHSCIGVSTTPYYESSSHSLQSSRKSCYLHVSQLLIPTFATTKVAFVLLRDGCTFPSACLSTVLLMLLMLLQSMDDHYNNCHIMSYMDF